MQSVFYATIAWCSFYAVLRKFPPGKPMINGKEAT